MMRSLLSYRFIFFREENKIVNKSRMISIILFGISNAFLYTMNTSHTMFNSALIFSMLAFFFVVFTCMMTYREIDDLGIICSAVSLTAYLFVSIGLYMSIAAANTWVEHICWLCHMTFTFMMLVYFGYRSLVVAFQNTKELLGNRFNLYKENQLLQSSLNKPLNKRNMGRL